jgi:hypothetical protein
MITQATSSSGAPLYTPVWGATSALQCVAVPSATPQTPLVCLRIQANSRASVTAVSETAIDTLYAQGSPFVVRQETFKLDSDAVLAAEKAALRGGGSPGAVTAAAARRWGKAGAAARVVVRLAADAHERAAAVTAPDALRGADWSGFNARLQAVVTAQAAAFEACSARLVSVTSCHEADAWR